MPKIIPIPILVLIAFGLSACSEPEPVICTPVTDEDTIAVMLEFVEPIYGVADGVRYQTLEQALRRFAFTVADCGNSVEAKFSPRITDEGLSVFGPVKTYTILKDPLKLIDFHIE